MNRVDRLLAYLLLLQSRGLVRAQDFAQRFEISERTVYRDIQALCEAGVPIMAAPGEGYRLMEGYYLPPIAFSPAEARAMFLAVAMLSGLTAGGATKTAALSALDKIRAVLPKATLRQVEALQAILHFFAFPDPPLDFDDQTFVRLQEAIQQQRIVHLHYHALHSGEVSRRDVEPMGLVFLDRAWVLSAYCRLRQAPRAFRLERIDKLAVRQEQFAPLAWREGPQRLGLYKVKVRFAAAIVRWVRERQHYTFLAEGLAEGPSTAGEPGVTMVYRPRSLAEIEGWLLSWGEQMEVVAPAELRQRLAATAGRILAAHQNNPL
jgi:predicted DNA-binding transcriptional regulator YafY